MSKSRVEKKEDLSVIDYIIYRSNEGDRRMVVIDGQPYYQSSGNNSKEQGRWFPFLMVRGSHSISEDQIPKESNFREDALTAQRQGQILPKPRFVMKVYSALFKKCDFPGDKDDGIGSRFPFKKMLIDSNRLGVFKSKSSPHAFEAEAIRQAEKQPIKLAKKPSEILCNPDRVNAWLAKQGAEVAQYVYSNKTEGVLDSMTSEQWNSIVRLYAAHRSSKHSFFGFSSSKKSLELISAMETVDDKEKYYLARVYIEDYPSKALSRIIQNVLKIDFAEVAAERYTSAPENKR